MTDLHAICGVKKLNHQNYKTWMTCMTSYMECQDLWEVVNESKVKPGEEEPNGALRKWKIKAGKTLFTFKTTIEEDVLEHIRDAGTPKEAWDTLAALFSKKNDTRLQLLESELLSTAQNDMNIAQYFHKVKSICHEISELKPIAPIRETRTKRIIIHGLRSEYRNFVTAVQGWQIQPSLVEFENMFVGQEAMAKQMGGVSQKGEDETLYINKSRGNSKQDNVAGTKINDDKEKKSSRRGELSSRGSFKELLGKKQEAIESNAAATSSPKEKSEDDWVAKAFFAVEQDELALTVTTSKQIDYENDWIVDSGCSNHMTGDKEKLQNLTKYKGNREVVRADDTKLSITHIGKAVVSPNSSADLMLLQNVYHVPELVMKGQRLNSVYVMSTETAYIDMKRKNETADLWHMRLSHFIYSKLSVMMEKSMLKGLPKLSVRTNVICAGCQYGKAHQLPYVESKYKAKEPLELIHSDEKFDTFSKFKEFKKVVEAEVGKKILCLRTDNGGEYTSYEFSEFLQKYQIRRQLTCPNTPQQNVIAERKNRHLAEICRSLLHAKNILGQFWAEAMKTAAFVINRIPQQSTGKCYTSRNVIFDEASSWWSSNKEILPDSNVLKDVLDSSHVQLSLDEAEDEANEDIAEEGVAHNPWQTGVYQ
ncbi:hypothetical protein KY289_033668 [Solanum tuberosum]|nr:hypothetical protein KY289_033668 [Solanum tuberosum]